MQNSKLKILILIFWAGLIILTAYGYFSADLTFEEVYGTAQELLQSSGIWAPVLYIVLYSFRSLVFFPASLLTIIAGMLFGPWYGLLYTLIGENISANISYIVGRHLMSDMGAFIFRKNKLLSRIINQIQGNGFIAVFLMRLAYLPFDLVGYSSGAFKIKQKDFALGTLLGTVPGLTAYTFLGSSIIDINYFVIGAVVLLASLSGAAILKIYFMKATPQQAES